METINIKDFIFDRVMLVDDTQIDRYIAGFVMKKHQFTKQIMEFEMATDAIKFLEQNQLEPEKLPQVIILDIRMPVMDGFQFLERVSLLSEFIKQSCCIVMLSSSLSPSDQERAENNPVIKKFMNKPLLKENLEEIKQLYLLINRRY